MTTPSTRPIPILRLDPRKDGLLALFGPREAEIMLLVWQQQRTTVKKVWRAITEHEVDLSYTTIMTTMSRLYEKGVLDRTKEGLAYIYAPVASREDFEAVQRQAILGWVERNIG